MKSEVIQDLLEFVDINKKLLIAVVIAVAGLLIMQNYIGGATMECLGIADSKETMVAFETPVVVKRIFVLPGQMVKKGQPLVEVEPAEINLKLLEVQTELEALRSEQRVRDTLLGTFSHSKTAANNPLAAEIAGLQAQADELRRQQANAVRYAEEDGVVATVAYRPREQVAPFMPIITLTSSVPNLVYGFIHETRIAEFKVGDEVIIEPVTDKTRKTTGKVVSVGNRIAPFHERFQIGTQQRPTVFGREVIVSLAHENQVLVGEKVSIRAEHQMRFSDFGFQAFAESKLNSKMLAEGLELEAGGLIYLPESHSLLVASDDNGPNGSPFWLLDLQNPSQPSNLKVSGLSLVEDVESLSATPSGMFAMSSLSLSKNGKLKAERNLILRFTIQKDLIRVDRALDLRTPLVVAMQRQPLLKAIAANYDSLDVEALTVDGSDAYLALKEPQLPDGSTIILKLRKLVEQIEAGSVSNLDLEVQGMVRFESEYCAKPARITDFVRKPNGLLLLSNCSKSEKVGHVWWLNDSATPQRARLIAPLQNARPEGMAAGATSNTLFITSDNGSKRGSDLMEVEIPAFQ